MTSNTLSPEKTSLRRMALNALVVVPGILVVVFSVMFVAAPTKSQCVVGNHPLCWMSRPESTGPVKP